MEAQLKLIRPRLSVGVKILMALTVVFWIPVIALATALYFSFHSSLFSEGLDALKTNLKGAQILYEERANNLKSLLEHVAGQADLKGLFVYNDSKGLQEVLLEMGKKNTHAEILIAVNEKQRVLSRKKGMIGDIIVLGDALSRSLMTGETVITTELISRKFLEYEEESLANRSPGIGIAQFVITPVRQGDTVMGALIAGILLSGEPWLGNGIHNRFGVEMALFAGETFESFHLHSTASMPRTTWVIGQPIPERLKEEISLGKPYYGNLDVDNVPYLTAFEPIRDSRNRIIGALGVSRPAKNIMLLVAETIGKVLLLVAAGALLVALLITAVIYLDITRPLNLVLKAMKCFETGELDTCLKLKTGDEFEKLGKCFNSMAESIRRREDRLKKHNQVAKLLMSTIDLEELKDRIVSVVLDVTESQMGILYLCNAEGKKLDPVVCHGSPRELPSLNIDEGLPGRALVERKCIIVHPSDKDISGMIEMGFTQFSPEDIVYIPLIFKETIMGVLVIGRLKSYSRDEQDLFNYLGNQISIALDNTIIHHRIQEMSISDHLTGLFNRRYLALRLEEEWARCTRQREPLSVLLADMDDFKNVNDTYGHDKGDEVLRNVGKILRRIARKEDVVARFGGEEFVAVFTNMTSADAAMKADEIRRAVENTDYAWARGPITVSVGVASYPDVQITDPEQLLQRADQAMYTAKTDGKNKVVVCT
ncbi:MAG: diguanylate cyclase [Nitrospiraceae bacterium]|nr:MAG: diguanylate cyclase [Nitrospiraceae bacterium]